MRLSADGQEIRAGRVRRVLLIILLLNWGVAAAKIIYGALTNLSSMVADGLHSLSDGASNIIGIVGISIASHPADKKHPYGYKKYETLFTLAIAGLLFFLAFHLLTDSVQRFFSRSIPRVDIASFVVMLVTIVVNIFVMLYETKKGKDLRSDILISDATHTKADIFTSLSVMAAITAVKMGYPLADPVISVIIALFIAYAGFSIIKESAKVLCDSVAIIDEKKIEEVVLSVKGVKTCHRIRTRGRTDDIYVDLHVLVNPTMHVDQAHKISSDIENTMKKQISGVSDVVVHIEPREHEKNHD